MKKTLNFAILIFLVFFISLSLVSAADSDNQTMLSTEKQSLGELQNEIWSADNGDTIVLECDYEWSEDDGTNGITIYSTTKNVIIDGNGHTIDGKNSARIFFINEGADNIVIKNLNFINGNSNGGGAILWRGSNGVLENNQFISNTGSDIGGAVYWDAPNGIIRNNQFNGNSATKQSGGGIYISAKSTKIIVTDNQFTNNRANTCGGGVAWSGAYGTLSNNVFTGNTVGESGGALYFDGANSKVYGNSFSNNQATGSGGAVYLKCDGAEFYQNTLTDNYAGTSGGAMRWNGNKGTATNNVFSNNKGGTNAGAMFWNGHDAVLKYNQFTGNTAQSTAAGALMLNGNNFQVISNSFTRNSAQGYGGAIYTTGSDNKLIDNSFTQNSAAKSGGAFYFDGPNGQATNNRFVENSGSGAGAIRWEGNGASITGNIFSGNRVTNGNIIYGDGSSATVSSNTFYNSKESDKCIRWNSGDARITNNIYKPGTPIDDSVVTVVCNGLDKYYGGSERLEITVLDKNSVGISNVDVSIFINGVSNTRTTDVEGKISMGINLNPGQYPTKITVNRYGKEKEVKVSVKSTLSGNDAQGEYKNTKYSAKFLNTNGNPLPDRLVEFNINGNTYKSTTNGNGIATLNVDLDCGNYVITAINPVNNERISNNIHINPIASQTSISAITGADVAAIKAKINSTTASGKVIFTKDNDNYEAEVKNGEANLYIYDLQPGRYIARATYLGDKNHLGSDSEDIAFIVKEYEEVILLTDNLTKYYKGPERLEMLIIDDNKSPVPNANVTIVINGQKMARTTNDKGEASIAVNLNSGNYTADIIVERYNLTETVSIEIKSTIEGSDITKIHRNGTQYYATFKDTNGDYLEEGTTIKFNINGVFYERQILNDEGLARLNINLNQGEYILTAINPVNNEQHSNKITVLSKIVNNNDLVKYYRNDSQYYVTLLDDKGNPVKAGQEVTFNINGVFYQRKTNEEGVARLNINLAPGNYVITANYKNCLVSNKIKVLPVLSAKDVKMNYRDGTKFIVKLVDGTGKVYAKQNIEFNVNGVFYTRTTNETGFASLNINLMPGEYIITSTYNGASIANKIKIIP